MDNNVWLNQVLALLSIALGIMACFWGYRILKLMLGIIGFIIGASAGWQLGLSWTRGDEIFLFLYAAVGGIIGALLCVWLYFLGVFLLGASAGAVLASMLFGAAGSQAQAIVIVVFAVVFGIIAVVVQKMMIIISTAFSGAYLAVAGILHFIVRGRDSLLVLTGASPFGIPGTVAYAGLAFWLVLGVLGMSFQLREGRRREQKPAQQA